MDRFPTLSVYNPMFWQFREISGTLALAGTLALVVGVANIAIIKAIFKDFKKNYYKLSGVNSFNKLNAASKIEWIDA